MLLSGVETRVKFAMNLDLWLLAESPKRDEASRRALATGAPADLRDAYLSDRPPPTLMNSLASCLARFGHRAVFEVDLGLPRWAEDLAHLLGKLKNHLGDVTRPDPAVLRARRCRGGRNRAGYASTRRPAAAGGPRFLIARAQTPRGYRE